MFDVLRARFQQQHRTVRFPKEPPTLPARYRGRPQLDATRCPADCRACIEACPTGALSRTGDGPAGLQLDQGRCLYCTACTEACPTEGAIRFGREYRNAARRREDLLVSGDPTAAAPALAEALDARARRLFGRSLQLRQVSAGGCNACEADTNVLGTVVYDLSRFGIQFVASPRHADGLLITGPVSRNMRLGLEKTWAAVPEPRLVIAVGACAIAGGPFTGNPETCGGVPTDTVPVDLWVPGCPPHPATILDGMLRLLGRVRG